MALLVPVLFVTMTVLFVTVVVMMFTGGTQDVPAGGQFVNASPFERVLRLQEAGIDSQRTVQVKRTQAQHRIDGQRRVLRAMDARRAVDRADSTLDAL